MITKPAFNYIACKYERAMHSASDKYVIEYGNKELITFNIHSHSCNTGTRAMTDMYAL